MIYDLSESDYSAMAGPDWPLYADFISGNQPNFVIEELTTMCDLRVRSCANVPSTFCVLPSPKSKKVRVIAPAGGFGNHIRWLLFLNPEFNCIYKSDAKLYKIVARPNWPTYEEYVDYNFVEDDFLLSDPVYLDNCKILMLDNIDSKVKFIQDVIYRPEKKTWDKWIQSELTYRSNFDPVIMFSHQFVPIDDNAHNLLVTINPLLALRGYLKFNSSLNNLTIPGFIDHVNSFNRTMEHISLADSNHNHLVAADSLYQDTLPEEFYDMLNSSIGLDVKYYDQARLIHLMWYKLHQQAEVDMMQYIQSMYSTPHVV